MVQVLLDVMVVGDWLSHSFATNEKDGKPNHGAGIPPTIRDVVIWSTHTVGEWYGVWFLGPKTIWLILLNHVIDVRLNNEQHCSIMFYQQINNMAGLYD